MTIAYSQARFPAFYASIMRMSMTKFIISTISILLLLLTLYNLMNSKPPRSVILLTGLTSKTLEEFNGVDDFLGKMWNNRLTYALAHGMYFILISHL